MPLTEFTTGELAGVDVAVFLISTIGRLNSDGSRDFGDGISYTDDQIAAIQAFASKGAVFLSDSTMLSTYMAYGDNRILAENIINYLVESGGGVLFLADNNGDTWWACDIDNWNELVAPFGIEYSLPLPDHNYPETWIYDFVEHPITEWVSVLRVLSYPKNTIVWPSQDLTVNPSPEDVLAVYPFPIGEVDGTLDPSTYSTVIDDVYGWTASVRNYPYYWDEWPTELTEVTPYVTDDPPAGMPGIEAQGTPFMHIQLDPPPASYPTPPMGINVRLPLLEPQPVGSVVYLMRVDHDTGDLLPADQWGITCDNWICPDPTGICFKDCPEYSFQHDQSLWTPYLNPDPAGCGCRVYNNPNQPCPSDVLQGEECGNYINCVGVASFSALVGVVPDEITLSIDIKPGIDTNPINLKKKGVVPVAILGTPAIDLDVETGDMIDPVDMIDPETLNFHGASPKHDLLDPGTFADHLEDLNGDGFMDLVIHFNAQEITGLNKSSTEGCLEGSLKGGQSISGCDSIRCK